MSLNSLVSSHLTDANLPCTSYGSGREFPPYLGFPDPQSSSGEFSQFHMPSENDRLLVGTEIEADDGLLDRLPHSIDDFDIIQSQLAKSPCFMESPAQSRLSSDCPSVEPPEHLVPPSDIEDLEVQWINESFEEQRKYNEDLKNVFYHGSSGPESKRNSRCDTDLRSIGSPLERPDRLPYARRITGEDRQLTPSKSIKPSNPTFEPVLTPKSEAFLKQRLKQKDFPQRRVSEPLARKPQLFWNTDHDISPCGSVLEGIDVDSPLVPELPVSAHTSFDRPVSQVTSVVPTASPLEDPDAASEQLAFDIIESVLNGAGGFTPSTPVEDSTEVFAKRLGPGVAARRLELSDLGIFLPPTKTTDKQLPVLASELEEPSSSKRMGDNSGMSHIKEEEEEVKASTSNVAAGPVVVKEDADDDWDAIDDEALDKKLEEMKLEARKKLGKPPIDYYAAPVEKHKWDRTVLKNVVEVFDVPEYKTCADVENALQRLGFDMVEVVWLENRVVFAAFASPMEAMAMQEEKHAWLRVRPLHQSSPEVQMVALAKKSILQRSIHKSRPKTHVGAARRMVEGALGVSSKVSAEQRNKERLELKNAREAKKNAVKWDD